MQKQILSLWFSHSLHLNRLRYVCDFIEQHPLANGQLKIVFNKQNDHSLQVDYNVPSGNNSNNYSIPAQQLFFYNNKDITQPLTANEYLWHGKKLHSVETTPCDRKAFLLEDQFQFDILETIFFHISRYEEWFCGEAQKDQWDMMEEEQQFLVANGLEQQPVVDQLVFAFLEALGFEPSMQLTQYRITHDIDAVKKFTNLWVPFRATAGLLRRGQGWMGIYKIWSSYLATKLGREKDPFDTFKWMLQKENYHQKVIYFLVGGTTQYDTPLELSSPQLIEALGLCKQRNYKIGIHPSYDSWKSKDLIISELQLLTKVIKQPIFHSRQHYLHFSFQHTPYYLEELGIIEDSSLGFNNRIGFRCGTGFPYHLYDFKNERTFKFTEVPLIVMDSALLKQAKYHKADFIALWQDFLSVNHHNTFITFNFHNSRFDDAWIHGIPLKKLYDQLSSPGIEQQEK